jgi:membrane protease YdiL (CAAX protease family)
MSQKLLADMVALTHGLLAVYVAGGALLIVIGVWRRWEFVRNFAFRYSHLLLCLGVNVFEWANLPCPLTSLEWYLRARDDAPGQAPGFIQHYVTQSIHIHVEPGVMARLTLPLLLFVAALYIWAGPRPLPEDAPPEREIEKPPSRRGRWWTVGMLCGLTLLAVRMDIPRDCLACSLCPCPEEWHYHFSFFLIALALCLLTPRTCGLGLGSVRRWRRHGLAVAVVLALPPLAVATVYAYWTSKPFHNIPTSNWFAASIAQELLFAGFIFGRLTEVWGTPSESWRGALARPMLVTPLLFVSWHWPVAALVSSNYFIFMCVYLLLGGWWMLNLRRWTGSIWPGAVLHVVVNYLAAKV